MGFFRRADSRIERAAMALAAAGGAAHVAFLTVFVWRIVNRGGIGKVGYALLALLALAGLALSVLGYWLIRHGGRARARRLGYLAVSASTTLAGGLLAIASSTS